MKKAVLYTVALVFALLLLISKSSSVMKWIVEYRIGTRSILASDKYRYGDLYGLSYLPDFRIENHFDTSEVSIDTCTIPRTTNLYIIGDSYLGQNFYKNEQAFCGVKRLEYVKHNSDDVKIISLNPEERNILLIESLEFYREDFKDSNYFINKFRFVASANHTNESKPSNQIRSIKELIHNPLVNQHLEFNLFDYGIFRPVKEAKASLNFNVFDRTDDYIIVAPDRKFLLRKETCEESDGSSFFTITEQETEDMITNINAVYNHYISKGFDEVYLSLIPNPVTILYPTQFGDYNGFIPKIQEHKRLQMPTVDIFSHFKNSEIQLYFTSDTHWNMNGFQVWLNVFNKKLRRSMNNF